MYRILTYSIVISIWTITCSIRPNPVQRGVFAAKVCVQGNGDLSIFFAFLDTGVHLTQMKILTKDEFIKFASGYWPSIYNPERRNFFKEHQLDCGVVKHPEFHQNISVCVPLDSLWKIRYSLYPFTNNNDKGWSKGLYRPSDKQSLYLLQRYGVHSFENNYFLDEKFWLLLQDVQDTSWVSMYKSL